MPGEDLTLEEFAEQVRRDCVKILRAVQHGRILEAGELAAALCTRSATIVQQSKMRDEAQAGNYDLGALGQYALGAGEEGED